MEAAAVKQVPGESVIIHLRRSRDRLENMARLAQEAAESIITYKQQAEGTDSPQEAK